MHQEQGRDIAVFDRDASIHGGYVYTTNNQLSSRLALQRMTDVMLDMGRLSGRSVLDLGCGDGFFTLRYLDLAAPRLIVGADPAPQAVDSARTKSRARPVHFVVGDGHRLPFGDDSFDLVVIQGVLHHDDAPRRTISEAIRLAPEVLILEANGYNPGLKVIEKTSRYHIAHGEKSFPARRLRRWIAHAGGRVVGQRFVGFVPMFCPSWLARGLKAVEPIVERLPLVNALACAYCVLLVKRRGGPSSS